MGFFENQDRARQNTQRLLVLFILCVGLIILALYFVTLFIFRESPRVWWNP